MKKLYIFFLSILFVVVLVFTFLFVTANDTPVNNWGVTLMNYTLDDVGTYSGIDVFYKDSSWYAITSGFDGAFHGYVFVNNGRFWAQNSTIISGLPDIGAESSSSVLEMGNDLYFLSGNSFGTFNGYAWNGTQWKVNSTINTTIGDSGLDSTTEMFSMNGAYYLLAGSDQNRLDGYVWNGAGWTVNTSINKTQIATGIYSKASVIYINGNYYMLQGQNTGTFYGYMWNGTQWNVNTAINASLPDIGSKSCPSMFIKDGILYMISGNNGGLFNSYKYNPIITNGSTGFVFPVSSGGSCGGWNTPSALYLSDGSSGFSGSGLTTCDFLNFDINIPITYNITNITFMIESQRYVDVGQFNVELSWNGGVTYTTSNYSVNVTDIGNYNLYYISGLWGRNWNGSDFNYTNFRLMLTDKTGSQADVDAISINVSFSTPTGGGGGFTSCASHNNGAWYIPKGCQCYCPHSVTGLLDLSKCSCYNI